MSAYVPPVPSEEHSDSDSARRIAVVDGDVTIDCHIASQRSPDYPSLWHIGNEKVPFAMREGGAALLGELIGGVARRVGRNQAAGNGWEVIARHVPNGSHENFPRLYSVWHQYERSPDESKGREADSKVWRISHFLGSQPAADSRTPPPLQAGERPSLVVLDDKGHGLRDDAEWWGRYASASLKGSWFLIRSGRPLLRERMWEELLKNHCSRLIAVTTVDDIRQSEVFVSRQLSWERTTQDLYSEVLQNQALSQFKDCAFIVVCFTASAAVLFENGGGTAPREAAAQPPALNCWLVYDPRSLEEEDWRDSRSGRVQGFTYCIMGAIASALFQCLPAESPTPALLTQAIKSGLDASRSLYRDGFSMLKPPTGSEGIAFPTDRVLDKITGTPTGTWGVVQVPQFDPAGGSGVNEGWTILAEQAKQNQLSLYELAKQVATKGVDVLVKEMPVYHLGKLLVADRREIEGYRSIRRLLNEYAAQRPDGGAGSRPLSIGVFGPPGSGKSFGIKQLAENAFKGIKFKPLTFNLSQLTNPDDLRGAFHQIRDEALRGKLPLVFWDEFDSTLNRQPLGWLRYFLAPMQDGLFQEGQVTHAIGRAVFIFAGGTEYTMKGFQEKYARPEDEVAKRRKVPDFISRLRGYLNIRGLDPLPNAVEDPLYVIRRAIILNGQLNEHAPRSIVERVADGRKLFNLDEGVLRALLTVSEYRHGARSMEAVISMSILSGRNRFERSSLPPTAQLDLHVPAEEFNRLLWDDPASHAP
ncbi:MAG TPA: AAA family ATPase [Pyrinomonadaceae bacterium]|jgi:hypothetical protein